MLIVTKLSMVRYRCARAATHVRDQWRSMRELGLKARSRAAQRWFSPKFLAVFEVTEPLVTICIATFNRAGLLTERTLPSLLRQSYPKLEILVVGDCCSDDTGARIAALGDPRVRFINLPTRGPYPEEPERRWMVAGSTPMNRALREARGSFITHVDDDDEYTPDRIEKLLALLRHTRSDFAFHPFRAQLKDGSWWDNPARGFELGYVTTSSVFYHSFWKSIEWDLEAWRYAEPGDWNRFRKIRFLGAKIARHSDSMLVHYREQNQADH